jgi:hypothetical protein
VPPCVFAKVPGPALERRLMVKKSLINIRLLFRGDQ